jgi:hypothetical protein
MAVATIPTYADRVRCVRRQDGDADLKRKVRTIQAPKILAPHHYNLFR